MEIYIATVQLAIKGVNSQAEAADGISELLSPLVGNSCLLDWEYLKLGGQYCYPTSKIVSDDYEEGEAFLR